MGLLLLSHRWGRALVAAEKGRWHMRLCRLLLPFQQNSSGALHVGSSGSVTLPVASKIPRLNLGCERGAIHAE